MFDLKYVLRPPSFLSRTSPSCCHHPSCGSSLSCRRCCPGHRQPLDHSPFVRTTQRRGRKRICVRCITTFSGHMYATDNCFENSWPRLTPRLKNASRVPFSGLASLADVQCMPSLYSTFGIFYLLDGVNGLSIVLILRFNFAERTIQGIRCAMPMMPPDGNRSSKWYSSNASLKHANKHDLIQNQQNSDWYYFSHIRTASNSTSPWPIVLPP